MDIELKSLRLLSYIYIHFFFFVVIAIAIIFIVDQCKGLFVSFKYALIPWRL